MRNDPIDDKVTSYRQQVLTWLLFLAVSLLVDVVYLVLCELGFKNADYKAKRD